jgi:hypothetical protein
MMVYPNGSKNRRKVSVSISVETSDGGRSGAGQTGLISRDQFMTLAADAWDRVCPTVFPIKLDRLLGERKRKTRKK